jgi:monovalent cation:H+ antiporter-2, CPA2 family
MDGHEFLRSLAIVLCTAGVTTVVFQRLKQPVVLGYLLAGLIVGPHVPIPLVADEKIIHVLSELGVILLMFALGLEFSLRKLVSVGPTASVTAIFQSSIMVWLGFMTGRAFGWTVRESLFTGALIAISSTTIIAKAFDEQGIRGKLRQVVVGVLVVEDLIAILLMALLTALASGEGLTAGTLVWSSARLAGFLVGLVVVGLLVVPRSIRAIVRLGRPETTLVASIGICFACALLAQAFGYSVALGAFLAGSLVAESGEEKTVEHLVVPVRDVFAAVFFVSVGMMIDPALVVRYWVPIVVLTLVVIGGKVFGVSLGAFLTGNGVRTSVQAGMSLAQIGEFSFIIAGLGITLGATGTFLYPVAIAVSAVTTLTTPWLIKAAGPAASFVDRSLPKPLQTFAGLYASWIENIRESRTNTIAPRRRLLRLLVLDAAVLAALIIGTSLSREDIARFARRWLPIDLPTAEVLVTVAAVVVALPFVLGLVRICGGLANRLAAAAFATPAPGTNDAAFAARRLLRLTLQLGFGTLVAVVLAVVTQPFVSGWWTAIGLLVGTIALSLLFWRDAKNLQGHVRAGAQVVLEALTAIARKGAPTPGQDDLAEVQRILPGIGDPVPLRLIEGHRAVGQTLRQLDVRGQTGATVLAVVRDEVGVLLPTANDALRAGDLLALAGTDEAVAAARELLTISP